MMAGDRYAFGDITVDFRQVELRRAGSLLSVEPKTFAVLRHLIENRDRVVSKDELLDVVWTGTSVTPNVLTRAIAQLRKALGDSAIAPRYVSTISKHGYRFIAPIADSEEPAALAKATTRDWRWATVLGVGAIVIAVALVTLWPSARERGTVIADGAVASPKRLTTDRHSYTFPAVSSDGSRFAYSSDRPVPWRFTPPLSKVEVAKWRSRPMVDITLSPPFRPTDSGSRITRAGAAASGSWLRAAARRDSSSTLVRCRRGRPMAKQSCSRRTQEG